MLFYSHSVPYGLDPLALGVVGARVQREGGVLGAAHQVEVRGPARVAPQRAPPASLLHAVLREPHAYTVRILVVLGNKLYLYIIIRLSLIPLWGQIPIRERVSTGSRHVQFADITSPQCLIKYVTFLINYRNIPFFFFWLAKHTYTLYVCRIQF